MYSTFVSQLIVVLFLLHPLSIAVVEVSLGV